MNRKTVYKLGVAGICAGIVNGLFGAGGGMVLVPLLTRLSDLSDDEIFPISVSIILPISLISLGFSFAYGNVATRQVIPYLIGSSAGGIMAGLLGKRIPTLLLHKALGIIILWGGIKYLC